MTMFVLSPSVEAMNASARSIPAAISASSSSPVPTVNWPPESSQDFSRLTSRRACASGSSSRHETSCPSRSIVRATDDPTRPQPTIRTNTVRILGTGGHGQALPEAPLRPPIRGNYGTACVVQPLVHGHYRPETSGQGPSALFGACGLGGNGLHDGLDPTSERERDRGTERRQRVDRGAPYRAVRLR